MLSTSLESCMYISIYSWNDSIYRPAGPVIAWIFGLGGISASTRIRYRIRDPTKFRVPNPRLPKTTPIPNHPGREAHVPHPKWPTCIARPRFSSTFLGEKVYSDVSTEGERFLRVCASAFGVVPLAIFFRACPSSWLIT
jgi:hypothetical protein